MSYDFSMTGDLGDPEPHSVQDGIDDTHSLAAMYLVAIEDWRIRGLDGQTGDVCRWCKCRPSWLAYLCSECSRLRVMLIRRAAEDYEEAGMHERAARFRSVDALICVAARHRMKAEIASESAATN